MRHQPPANVISFPRQPERDAPRSA
jgi:hypothetical protein